MIKESLFTLQCLHAQVITRIHRTVSGRQKPATTSHHLCRRALLLLWPAFFVNRLIPFQCHYWTVSHAAAAAQCESLASRPTHLIADSGDCTAAGQSFRSGPTHDEETLPGDHPGRRSGFAPLPLPARRRGRKAGC